MGYSLYWDYNPDYKKKSFTTGFLNKVAAVIRKANAKGIELGSWDGEISSQDSFCKPDAIKFNGVYPKSCETFELMPSILGRELNFDFCKTRGYPYTVVCIAILKLAEKTGIITSWKTDNGPEHKAVMDLYNKVYGDDDGEEKDSLAISVD